jgi:ADP-heptose:LPS heptosyltransferase
MTILVSKINQLGDNVVFLPVVQALQRVLPQARIVVATSPVAAPLYEVCAPGCEVITYQTTAFNSAWKRPWALPGLALQWRSLRPSAVLLGDDQGNVAHLLAALSGADLRVGVLVHSLALHALQTHSQAVDFTTHVAHQNWLVLLKLLGCLGVEHDLPALPPAPDLSALASSAAAVQSDVVIHAGASREYKRWPLSEYVGLANALAGSRRVLWIEQPGALEQQGLVPAVMRVQPGGLAALIATLSHTRLFVGNNSGPMNIASAVGTPSLIFNGPSVSNWDPAWHRERCRLLVDPLLPCQPCDKLTYPVNVCSNLAEPMACMNRWSVERVAAIAHDMLS